MAHDGPAAAASHVLAAIALLLGSAGDAVADDRGGAAQCYDAHEAGQVQRKRGELQKARVSFATCGRSSCPAIVQRDCVAWATELAVEQPSVVIAIVRDDGRDVLIARVSVDGLGVEIDGRAIELDPGEHRARVEIAGRPPLEQRFAVREGDRARRVSIVLASEKRPRRLPPPPTVSYVLGGIAVASVASFGTFAWLGTSREDELSRTCVDRCSDSDVAGVRGSYLAADISLGVAIVAAGAAVVTWLLAPREGAGRPSTASSAPASFRGGLSF